MQTTPCKKAAFRDEVAADLFIAGLYKKTKVRARMPKRSYYCDKCGFWHITSKKDRLQERIEELEAELSRKNAELELLKRAEDKEDRVAVKADLRVQQLTKNCSDKDKTIARLRKDISTLVSKIATQTTKE